MCKYCGDRKDITMTVYPILLKNIAKYGIFIDFIILIFMFNTEGKTPLKFNLIFTIIDL